MSGGEPPAKRSKEPTTISMVVEDQLEQSSSIYRIYGYPWHLRLTKTEEDTNYCRLTLHCDMSEEAELWKCSAIVTTSLVQRYELGCKATKDSLQDHRDDTWARAATDLTGHLMNHFGPQAVNRQGGSAHLARHQCREGGWNPRPLFAYAFAPRDFTLVLEGTKKIHVNSAILAEQSQFFERLFSIYKEKNVKEIPIEKLNFTDLSNVLSMIDRTDKSAYLSDDNALEVLKYARYLRIQIIEDRVVSFLLSSSSTMSNHKKLFIAESFQIPLLKDMTISRYTAVSNADSAAFSNIYRPRSKVFKRYFSQLSIMTSPPPEKKYKELATISMVVEQWGKHQQEQLSPVVRVDDYGWRLRLHRYDSKLRYLSLMCDKSKEAALWECIATVKTEYSPDLKEITFASWIEDSNPRHITLNEFTEGTTVSMEIVQVRGDRPRLRPLLDQYAERDGIIWIGREKVHVNKQSLSVQSTFFKDFFANEHKRNKPNEFVLQNVTYEEFRNVLDLYYGFDGASVTDGTIHHTLILANRYDLQRLLIAEQCRLPFLKSKLIRQYTAALLKELCNDPVWTLLSPETTRELMNKRCDL
ncbi:hypothetical protein PRIPAC_94790 [Pristionchus pacificus]|uniref:BTB domain-containing protein n=1 Tax=Pristionchus pacificus TaxID=54126 RepID=A0A2A6CHI9_PRIPA|nr:hypothetical protein PRIPAC_94790 [Pristionchus pacificus]|eukprot:PDM77599.1 BTB domain-containing protein [Pristionchus pacificus]